MSSTPTNVITAVAGQCMAHSSRSNTPQKRQVRHRAPKIQSVKRSKTSEKSKNPSYSIERRQQKESHLLGVQQSQDIETSHQEDNQIDSVNSEIVDDPSEIAPTQYIPPVEQECENINPWLRYLQNM